MSSQQATTSRAASSFAAPLMRWARSATAARSPLAMHCCRACRSPALVCNSANLLPGDRSRYLLADAIHPTPYAHGLIADFALQQMREAGWR